MSDEPSLWQQGLRQQVYLGDAAFVERMLALATARQRAAPDVPKPQRQSSRTWTECLDLSGHDRTQALRMAYREGGMAMTALAQAVGLSVSRVRRLIAAAKTVEPGQDWGQVFPFAQERIDALGQRIADHDAAAGELTHPVTRRQPATGQPGRRGAVRLRA